jgi:glycosyltransferase involved in cell wall biosynthesis
MAARDDNLSAPQERPDDAGLRAVTTVPSKVRVLIVHPRDLAAPTQGGIQTFLNGLLKYAPQDIDITVAGVTSDRQARPIGETREVLVDGRQAWTLPLAPAGRLPRNPIDIARMVRAQVRLRRLMMDPQTILQVHRPFRPIVLAGRRGPRIQFVHLDQREWPGASGWDRFGHLYQPLTDRELRSIARVFVVTELGAEILRQGHPDSAEKIEFLPVWYDPNVFYPPSAAERQAERAALAARYGWSSDVPLVLFAGRLDANKDPVLAIETLGRFVAAASDLRLLVAGEGPEEDLARQAAVDLGVEGQLRFLGDLQREDLAALMRAVDALLLTSHAEGSPRVVTEALASGVPVVSTMVGDLSGKVANGVNGWLVEEREADALAQGLSWAISQPREGIAAAAAAAVAPYTAEHVLSRVYQTYRELAAAQPAPRRST